MPTVTAFDEDEKFMVADHDGPRLIYVPHLKARGSQALLEACRETPEGLRPMVLTLLCRAVFVLSFVLVFGFRVS